MEKLVVAMLAIAGLIKLAPIAGVLGAQRMERFYGISIDGSGLEVLMRHRALLLGLVGALLLAAIFKREWRVPALAAGLVSALGFLALGWPVGELSAALRKVFYMDVVATGALLIALAAYGATAPHS